MLESDILFTAIDNLKKQTGATIEVTDRAVKNNKRHWDTWLKIYFGQVQQEFRVEVKKQVHRSNLPSLFRQLHLCDLLVAQYISQPSKVLLEEKGINYLDTAGNCFIKSDLGLFWKINHLKNEKVEVPNQQLILHKNGVKLIFALLIDDKLINEPYRIQAAVAGISLGTIGKIYKNLVDAKFVYQLNKRKKLLANKTELLNQWTQAYNQKLKPKLSRGKYRFVNKMSPIDWQKKSISDKAYWGGEPAASALTNYLQPEILMLYTNMDRGKLTKRLMLIPNPKGDVQVNSIFWNTDHIKFVDDKLQTVHPLLVYADLIVSADQRNIETANKIYEKYLKSLLESNNG